MSIGLAFWVLMLVWLAVGCATSDRRSWPTNIALFILLALLGWQVFGSAIHK
jgi:hypothetical protein